MVAIIAFVIVDVYRNFRKTLGNEVDFETGMNPIIIP